MVFLASDAARGVNGNIMFVDGGTDALLNSEKVYSIKETKEFISKNPNYTAIETIGGFKLIPDDKADVHIKTIRQRRNDFIERLFTGEEF